MGGVLLKAQHTLNLHIFSMSTCHEYLSFVPHSPSLFSFLSVQNNRRFERIALRNGRKREAHKEVLLCIPSSIPTPSSPLLFLSALFFFLLSSLFLLRQALQVRRHMTELTSIWLHILNLQPCKCGNQSKMHVLQLKDRQHMQHRGTKRGKEQKKETDRA